MRPSSSRPYTGYVILVANILIEESIPYFPREYGWTFALVVGNPLNNVRSGHSRLAPADRSWLDAARLVIAAEYLTHASVRDLKHSANVARSGALMRELDNLLTGRVGQWTTVDEDAAKLVHSTMT